MTNSDTTFGVHNKKTTIYSQPYDGSTALQEFSDVTEAKAWFFEDATLTIFDECATQLSWEVVNDSRGDATSLKQTIAFGTKDDASAETWADALNRRMKAEQDASEWNKRPYDDEDSSDHLF